MQYSAKETTEHLLKLEPLQIEPSSNILSVDVEDWIGTSCVPDVYYLLELFSNARAKATFFVLSSVAEREPELIRQIDREGHEIASHGGTHEQLFKKDPQTFHDELKQATDILHTITGKKVLGYRAPHFSIFKETCSSFYKNK